MKEKEYLLEEISYLDKENSRVMESVLKSWFQEPKTLNFVSPSLTFPFQFRQWVKKYYSLDENKIASFIIRNKKWIVGHGSIQLDNHTAQIFHVFIDKEFRRKRLATLLIDNLEKIGIKKEVSEFTINIVKKNKNAIKLCEELGYIRENKSINKIIKMKKII